MVVYGDHSLYIWDINDVNEVSALYNSNICSTFRSSWISAVFISFLNNMRINYYLISIPLLNFLELIYGYHLMQENIKIFQATRCFVLVSHSASIWDIKNLCCENMHDPSLACVARGCPGGVSFSTCSADGTTRLWDLVLQPDSLEDMIGHGSSNIEPMGTAHFGNHHFLRL